MTVRRTIVDGKLKPYGKTDGSLRTVPLPAKALEVLDRAPARLRSGGTRLETPILFPAVRGGPIALSPWRWREWYPALDAAGIERRVPYALRHTYAALSIAAGVSLFELARFMGTSSTMIEKTYGHLLPDALDRGRSALDRLVDALQTTEADADADGITG